MQESHCGRDGTHGPHEWRTGRFLWACPGAVTAPSDPTGGSATPPSLPLHDWWRELAQAEASEVAAKARRYGPNSMLFLGHGLAAALAPQRQLTDEEAFELACLAYVLGKVGRWIDATAHSDPIGTDTLHDLSVYPRMVQRWRDAGHWPGPNPEPEQADGSRRVNWPTDPPGESAFTVERNDPSWEPTPEPEPEPCGRRERHPSHAWTVHGHHGPAGSRLCDGTPMPDPESQLPEQAHCGRIQQHEPHLWRAERPAGPAEPPGVYAALKSCPGMVTL